MAKKKNKLLQSPKIEVRKSGKHGYGVFAKENIVVGDRIEECWYMRILHDDHVHAPLQAYTFKLKNETGPEDAHCLLFGYGSLYNCSETADTANVEVILNNEIDLFVFTAVKDIRKNEELCIYYGDYFWEWYNTQKEK